MAEAWGKITGEPGICFVTRGPGAANAMSGLHVAHAGFHARCWRSSACPRSGHEDREAFQEIEIKQLFGSLVKWSAVIRQTERIPEYVSHAMHVARSGRPGPVVLGLPEDMLAADCERPMPSPRRIAASPSRRRRHAVLQEKLAKAARPLDDHRRARLERGRPEGDGGLRRPLRPAGGAGLPLPGLLRQPAPLLRRLRRHRHRSQARRRHQGRGRADRAGRAPRRDDDQRLHADRHPRSQAVPRAHPPLARRAGLGLPPRPADRRQRARLHRGAGRPPAAGRRSPGPAARRAARGLRASLEAHPPAGRGEDGRRHRAPSPSCCPRTASSPTAPATSPPSCTATSSTRATAPASPRPRAPWATGCRRRSRPSSPHPRGPWSACRATAISS